MPGRLVAWANQRYSMGWTPDTLRSTPPQKVREQLVAASRKIYEEQRIEKEVEAAQACATDAELDAHIQQRFKFPIPDSLKFLEGEERKDAIRSLIESILRAELLTFERTILLDTFDQCWRDHLYAMDQLRDSINFRAFSQQDPRIEYKREGSHMFLSMMQTTRDRVTDYVFKARLSAQAMMAGMGEEQQAPRPVPRAAPPRPSGGPTALPGAGSITGPGLG